MNILLAGTLLILNLQAHLSRNNPNGIHQILYKNGDVYNDLIQYLLDQGWKHNLTNR